ncbi:hypothetical protein [Rickettsia montanensis]|uniref:Lipoprotein n=1 Tax=Rickettsia montanensis (strain OSU 85-930) TaxID=1105114 RepID=H8KA73_RICMS|nr:hypothetical protein [Rickettsia montanensis]AFC74189.1 hypothetical protein MCI_07030 [Rickettsia montanensis str. OSU 85-930]
MLKKIIILFLGIFLLSACTDNFRSYFQRSANNRLVDSKGAKGGKRKPVYNNKYITLAKKNIVEDNLDYDNDDDDEYDSDSPLRGERIDPVKRNREMYLKMIKRDIARQKAEAGFAESDDDMTLSRANKKVRKDDSGKEKKIQEELNQIKAMLRETKRDISKYTCPNAVVNQKHYAPPVTNYEPVNYPPVKNSKPYNNNSKVKQKFIREDDDNGSNACSI